MKGSVMLCPPLLAAQSVASTASTIGSAVSAVSDAAGTVNTIADNISPLLEGQMDEQVSITEHEEHITKVTPLIEKIINEMHNPRFSEVRSDVISFKDITPARSCFSCCSASTMVVMSVPGTVREAVKAILPLTEEGVIINALSTINRANRPGQKGESAFIAALFIALISRVHSGRVSLVFCEFGYTIAEKIALPRHKPRIYLKAFDHDDYEAKNTLLRLNASLYSYFATRSDVPQKILLPVAYRDMCSWNEALQSEIIKRITGVSVNITDRPYEDKDLDRIKYIKKCYSQSSIPKDLCKLLFLPDDYNKQFLNMIKNQIGGFSDQDDCVKQVRFLYFFYREMADIRSSITEATVKLTNIEEQYMLDLAGFQIAFSFLSYIKNEPQHLTVFSKIVMRAYKYFIDEMQKNYVTHNDVIRLLKKSSSTANDVWLNNTSIYVETSAWAQCCHKLFSMVGDTESLAMGMQQIIKHAISPPKRYRCPVKSLCNLADIIYTACDMAFEDWYKLHHPQGEMASKFFNKLSSNIQRRHKSALGTHFMFQRTKKPVDELYDLVQNYKDSTVSRASRIASGSQGYRSHFSDDERGRCNENLQFANELKLAIKKAFSEIDRGINSGYFVYFAWPGISNKMEHFLLNIFILFGMAWCSYSCRDSSEADEVLSEGREKRRGIGCLLQSNANERDSGGRVGELRADSEDDEAGSERGAVFDSREAQIDGNSGQKESLSVLVDAACRGRCKCPLKPTYMFFYKRQYSVGHYLLRPTLFLGSDTDGGVEASPGLQDDARSSNSEGAHGGVSGGGHVSRHELPSRSPRGLSDGSA